MYKVMLIDDDVPMLKFLQQLIDWESLEVKIVGTTYSSVKALDMFAECMPDFVITDIGLPKMNGLDLAAEFLKIHPGVRIIFLTCHEDFHYAKQALQLNADDYLIKDELTAEQLEQSVRKCVRVIRTQISSTQQEDYREELNRNKDLLKQSLWERLLKGGCDETLRGYARRLDIRWERPFFKLGYCYIHYSTFVTQYDSKDIELIRYGIYNMGCELARHYDSITLFYTNEVLVALLNYQPDLKVDAQQYLETFFSELEGQCSRLFKVKIGFVLGGAKMALTALGTEFHDMKRSTREVYYSSSHMHIWKRADSIVPHEEKAVTLEPESTELSRAMESGDPGLLRAAIQGLAKKAETTRLNPMSLKQACARSLRLMELKHPQSGGDERFYMFLGAAHRLQDTLDLVQVKAGQMIAGPKTERDLTFEEPKLQAIQQYIYKHLSENISSIDVANHLFLNPSYFSRYFKRLTGNNFTDYVHQYKMKEASNLLKNQDDSVEWVALKLGYSDRTYFSKVFKKYLGITPGEYKAREQRKSP